MTSCWLPPALRRHVLPRPDCPAPRNTGLREPTLGQEESSARSQCLPSDSSLRPGLLNLPEEGTTSPNIYRAGRGWKMDRTPTEVGGAGGWTFVALYVQVTSCHSRPLAFWGDRELLDIDRTDWEREGRRHILLSLTTWVLAFPLQSPVTLASCMLAGTSHPRQRQPRPIPLEEKMYGPTLVPWMPTPLLGRVEIQVNHTLMLLSLSSPGTRQAQSSSSGGGCDVHPATLSAQCSHRFQLPGYLVPCLKEGG